MHAACANFDVESPEMMIRARVLLIAMICGSFMMGCGQDSSTSGSVASTQNIPSASMPGLVKLTAAPAQDVLWYAASYDDPSKWGACVNPSSQESIASCFNFPAGPTNATGFPAIATDGAYVYFAPYGADRPPGKKCPVADLGANCTLIETGPFGDTKQRVTAFAAYDGQIYIGQSDGKIYRCPSNLPPSGSVALPAQCILLDDAGDRGINSMLVANGRLYVGLAVKLFSPGLIWSCDLLTEGCFTLDTYGGDGAYSMTYDGSYLWVGLWHDGILWRCNPNKANDCSNWNTLGAYIQSIAFDGQGTIYVSVGNSSGPDTYRVMSCPTAVPDSCSTLFPDKTSIHNANFKQDQSVTAGAGKVFMALKDGIYSGTTMFSGSADKFRTQLLFIPAGGLAAAAPAASFVGY